MTFRILHYSDVEGAFDRPERIARLASCIDHHRDDRTIVVGTGDNTGPSVLSRITGGRVSLDLFSAIGTDVETFGNHEFDHGLSAVRTIVRESPQTWISANIDADARPFGNGGEVVPSTTVERGDSRIGLIGVTDPRTPTINPNARTVTVADPIEPVRHESDRLRTVDGVDAVIVLSHLGEGDRRLARAVDVEAILGGHTHDRYIERINGTTIAKPGVGGEGIVELVQSDGSLRARHVSVDSDLRPNGSVLEAVRTRIEANGLDEVVAVTNEPIDRTTRTVFGGECRIGNWVADAYRHATGADVGLQNSGGIRAGPPLVGEITVGECMGIAPFNEPIGIASLTGRELLAVLRGARGGTIRAPDRWHAHLSGVRMVWDDERNEPTNVTINDQPLDLDGRYTLATSNYVFETPHEFPALETGHQVDAIGVQYDVLVEHARTVGFETTDLGRITRVNRRHDVSPADLGPGETLRGTEAIADPADGSVADPGVDR